MDRKREKKRRQWKHHATIQPLSYRSKETLRKIVARSPNLRGALSKLSDDRSDGVSAVKGSHAVLLLVVATEV